MLKNGLGGVDGLDGNRAVDALIAESRLCHGWSMDDAVSWYERDASTGALTYGGMFKDGVNGVDGLALCPKRDAFIGREARVCVAAAYDRCGELVREKRKHGSVDLSWDVEGWLGGRRGCLVLGS